MKSFRGLKLVAAIGGLAASAMVMGCGSDEKEPDCVGLACMMGSGGGGGDGGGGNTGSVCTDGSCEATGACFPDKAANPDCYGASVDGIGDECFAKRIQNEGSANEKRLQYKLAWARSTDPPGNRDGIVYTVLSSGANVPQPAECNQSGLGVFQQLLDIDLTSDDPADHRVRSGWSQAVPASQDMTSASPVPDYVATDSAISDGLCMIVDTYDSPDYNLDVMSPTTGWPENLPPPMARGPRGSAGTPWQVKPAVNMRVMEDFDVATDRVALLAQIATAQETEPEITGVTFIDEGTGYSHSYVPLTWVVPTIGADAALPIREVETKYQLNDPSERACMGAYRGSALDPSADCLSSMDPNNPEWGHYNEMGTAGTAPNKTEGYFLITELEQIYSDTQAKTFCVSYPGNEADGMTPAIADEGFYNPDTRSCVTENWDPSDPVNGLPHGDWCAATNGPATDDCHDAWRSVTWQVFQAFPVKPPGTACPMDAFVQ